ncbi:DUF1549 domain-containing protein [Pirellulaceae bacterium SH501]
MIPKDIDQTLEPGVVPHAERKESHWAWPPLKNPAVPEVAPGSFWATWVRSDIDKFVARRLQQESLTPVADAAKSSLLRRLTFDLTGLPPTEFDERLLRVSGYLHQYGALRRAPKPDGRQRISILCPQQTDPIIRRIRSAAIERGSTRD